MKHSNRVEKRWHYGPAMLQPCLMHLEACQDGVNTEHQTHICDAHQVIPKQYARQLPLPKIMIPKETSHSNISEEDKQKQARGLCKLSPKDI